MRRISVILCGLLLCAGLFWRFPLFHVVRPEALQTPEDKPAFKAVEFSQAFWKERLIPSLNQAADAETVLKAFATDQQAAREKFGRKVGVSRTRHFVLRGNGKIVSVDKTGVGIGLGDEGNEADIELVTGLLFGNAVRDVTGLLDAGNFSNSQHFNEISTELNRIVETRVIPALKNEEVIGRTIHFAGCVEIPDDSIVTPPLRVIPLDVSIQ